MIVLVSRFAATDQDFTRMLLKVAKIQNVANFSRMLSKYNVVEML